MDTTIISKNIEVNKVKIAHLSNYNTTELIYIYLDAFKIPAYFSIENADHQKLLYTDFLDFIKSTRIFLTKQKFIDDCRWWWNLIDTDETSAVKKKNAMPLFSYFERPISNIKPRVNVNILQLYDVISNPKFFERQTNEIRNIEDPEKKRLFKTIKFDYVTFSGTFEKRNSQSIINQSGYLCIDIDHVTQDLKVLKSKLIDDHNLDIQLLFVSPSGEGLKVVVPYNFKQHSHLKIFELLEIYFLQVYNVQIDKACKNIDRACFICFDKEVFINPKLFAA